MNKENPNISEESEFGKSEFGESELIESKSQTESEFGKSEFEDNESQTNQQTNQQTEQQTNQQTELTESFGDSDLIEHKPQTNPQIASVGGWVNDDRENAKNSIRAKISDSSHVEQIVDKIVNDHTECHFTQDNKKVCSEPHIIEKMEQYLVKKKKIQPESKNPEDIVKNMREALDCNSESCIFKRHDFIEFAKLNNIDSILDKFFKPEGPAIGFDLLSNFNIDNVLDQFEKKFNHKNFLHIPFQMRDFEKVGSEMASIDIADKFKNGHKTFGVVLNTDVSTGKGIHWFCLYGEHYGHEIGLEYFNSSGKQPLPEVQAWLNKHQHHIKKNLNKDVKVYSTTGIQFQDDEFSCGVYCLAYIWLRLEGVPFHWFNAKNFNDSMMHRLRRNLFRHEK
jgi:hypothetical protein